MKNFLIIGMALVLVINTFAQDTYKRVKTSQPVVALTFDDGPHPDFTPRVLDILSIYDARATFFMIGKRARQYPHLIKEVAEAGHSIGNHSWDHQPLIGLSRKERKGQIRACKKALYPYGEMIFRPPKGYQNHASRIDVFFGRPARR